MRRFASTVLLLLICLACALPVLAGGGPSGYLVVYDRDDQVSVTVANHYQQVRGIPECNMAPVSIHYPFEVENAQQLISDIRAHIERNGLAGQVQGIALAGYFPLGCNMVGTNQMMSLPAIIYCSPNTPDLTKIPRTTSNQAYRKSGQPTIALSGTTPIDRQTYWPVSYVGMTDRMAFSLPAAMKSIDEAKAADGRKPDGIIYWPLNDDIRSTTREPEINEVLPIWDKMGIKYSILDGAWVSHRGDISGGILGLMRVTTSGDNQYLPGTWVDHLTSFGGVLSDDWPYQIPCTDFLLAGAAGSSGTMAEPFALTGKFTHANIHTHFRAGASLGEAYWESLQMLYEDLPVGDPLMQPFATFPQVTIQTPKANTTVRGRVTITATATGAEPLEPACDLFVDGHRVRFEGNAVTRKNGSAFELDTSTLSDGWHEVRVVAYNADAVRTQSEAVLPLIVDNHKQEVKLTGPTTVTPATALTVNVATRGLANTTSLAIRANGRVLATATQAGKLVIPAEALPLLGSYSLYAVATLPDGSEAWSAPLTVSGTWGEAAPVVTPPFSSGLARVRFIADTTAPNFNWDTAPAVEGTLDRSLFFEIVNGNKRETRFSIKQNTLVNLVPDWKAVDFTKRPGIECTFHLQIFSSDIYSFLVKAGGEMFMDGKPVSRAKNGMFGPLPLTAGWHTVRLRTIIKDDKFSLSPLLRGGSVVKSNGIPLGWCVAPTVQGAPAAPKVAITQVGNTQLTGPQAPATVEMTEAKANLVALAEPAGELTYSWYVLSAPWKGSDFHPDQPADVVFKPNNSAQARETTATFSVAGEYLLQVRAGNDATSSLATVRIFVKPVVTSIWIGASQKGTLAQGYSRDCYAAVLDQFGRRMDINEPFVWASTPAGKMENLTGETMRFHAGDAVGDYRISATAAGKTGKLTIKVLPNQPPQILDPPSFSSMGRELLRLDITVQDPEGSHGRPLVCRWTVEKQPAGQPVELISPNEPRVNAIFPGPGAYQFKFTATDEAGAVTTALVDVTLRYTADGMAVYTPLPRLSRNRQVVLNQKVNIVASGVSGHAECVWEASDDNGVTWQTVATTDNNLIIYGPVTEKDKTRLFRVRVTNEVGTATSNAVQLTVKDK